MLLAFVLVALVIVCAGAYWWMNQARENAARTEPVKIGMVGFPQQREAHVAFKERMKELGYTEDVDIVYVEGEEMIPGPTIMEDMQRNIQRLLDADVDLMWLSLELQTKVAVDLTKQLGDTTPIVFISRFHDPVDYGLVASYRSSGNNVTGVASNLFDIVQKHLDFYKQINPDLKTIGVFTHGFWVPILGDKYFEELEKQAAPLGITIKQYTTTVPPPEAKNEFDRIAATIQKGDIDALIHLPGHHYELQQEGETQLATHLGIPHAAPFEDLPDGGHFSYSDIFGASARQSATLVDKIIKGAKPSDLPVEYGAHSELWLVMDRAKEAGITFPASMLFQAAQKFESKTDIPKPL